MSKCQYPGCHKEAKMKWCVTHNSVVSRERATKRWKRIRRGGKLNEPKGHAAYAMMILGASRELDNVDNDYASRPLGITGVEFEVRRGSKMPRNE